MAHTLDQKVNYFALTTFRDTADRDYVHARIAFFSGLHQQFRWSSLHCLEKYVKCILLLNRIDTKKIGHNVTIGLARIKEKFDLGIELSDEANAFIQKIEDGGKDRYFEVSYDADGLDFNLLDLTVWEIRRYCQTLYLYDSVGYEKERQLQENLNRIRSALLAVQKGTCITGGWLEEVIVNKKHPARKALILQNLYFGSGTRKKVTYPDSYHFGNAPLYVFPEILEEVAKYVTLDHDYKKGYEALAKKRINFQ